MQFTEVPTFCLFGEKLYLIVYMNFYMQFMLALFCIFVSYYVLLSFNSTPGTPGDCTDMRLHLDVSRFNFWYIFILWLWYYFIFIIISYSIYFWFYCFCCCCFCCLLIPYGLNFYLLFGSFMVEVPIVYSYRNQSIDLLCDGLVSIWWCPPSWKS